MGDISSDGPLHDPLQTSWNENYDTSMMIFAGRKKAKIKKEENSEIYTSP